MVVDKRQRSEKPMEIEQRKVQGLEGGPQVEQTALLAGPIYIGQAQGEEDISKEESKGQGSPSFSSRLLGRHALMPRGCIFLYFLNKTEL